MAERLDGNRYLMLHVPKASTLNLNQSHQLSANLPSSLYLYNLQGCYLFFGS